MHEKYIEAGKIAKEVREYGASLIKVGASMLEVLDAIEDKIYKLCAKPAFPAQISLNHVAAHDCADPNDDRVFKEGDVAKLDVGVHVDGYVADTATTVDLGDNKELLLAAKEALDAAISVIKPGVTLGEIGAQIHTAITKRGFSPIRNLSGHGLGKYIIHGPPTIPNYATGDKTQLKEDQVIAIEPFATDGAGMIYETDYSNIFMQVNNKNVRSPYARKVLKKIYEYEGLPFTTRWLTKDMSEAAVKFGLKELLQNNIIKNYPALPDKNKGLVAQFEHTVIVKDKPIVTTL